MNVEELFQSLSFGELSNLSLADNGSGKIIESQQPKVIKHVNEALLRIYSKFVLKEDDLIIELVEHINNYELKLKFAESYKPPEGVEKETYTFIKDKFFERPFANDVIRILKVFNQCGQELPLNNDEFCSSLYTPRPKTLQVPNPTTGHMLSVSYQARHKKLSADSLDDEIELPESLEGALNAYVASSIFTDMGGSENLVRGQNLMSRYESICLEVEQKDVISVSNSRAVSLFERKGWV